MYKLFYLSACVIRPNVDTLTLRNPLGRIVEFHCQCVNSDGTETEAMWWFQDGNSATSAPTQTFSNLANPALYIPNPFDNSKDGTYICSPGMANDPTRDTVTLDLGSKCISIFSIVICIQMYQSYGATKLGK